ncbi:spoVR family protein [bacterium BMS3Bbin04]|nr:spoVR family protein [bacterium BMS3Bbin04]
MELISQHTKAIMEECKLRARDAGLVFDNESLEYIVTNRDLIELSAKVMIPTLYEYWVQDVEVLQGHGRYKLFPNNPYETVINSRPAISFYNDNNPDWLNIMIFYHVIAHIDFFQNNIFFEHTWSDDFVGQALADKRLIESLRSEHGRWLDYVIEFSRGLDNMCGFYKQLSVRKLPKDKLLSDRVAYYFDDFLQVNLNLPKHEIYREIERYNKLHSENVRNRDSQFFADVRLRYPEFNATYNKNHESRKSVPADILEYIRDKSPKLQSDEHSWMKTVIDIVRGTSIYFDPQIRTKVTNEGWASYWHDELFRKDDRIIGHEVAYAKTNAAVTSISRIGLNPYAIGMRLIRYVEELANKGKMQYEFQRINNYDIRNDYDDDLGAGRRTIYDLRTCISDYSLINTFVDQDFVDRHKLFVAGKMLNEERRTFQYYVKSRNASDYKNMLIDSLYHPPLIRIIEDKSDDSTLYLSHEYEGKQLINEFIGETMIGIEYLWGGNVQLETTDIILKRDSADSNGHEKELRRVLYTMSGRKLEKKVL